MRLKHLLRYPFDIRIADQQLAAVEKTAFNADASTIGLDLYTDQLLIDGGRHLACLAAFADKIGSTMTLRCSRLLLAAVAHKPYGGRLLSMPHVRWIDSSQSFPARSLVLLDVDGARTDRDLRRQRTVAMLVGRDPVDKTLIMPYPMHPTQIANLTPEELDTLRAKPKAGIFFAGNQNRRYGRESMRNEFGVLPRLEVLSVLRQQFGHQITDRESDGRRDQIVLRNSDTDPIAARDWMSMLASHRFFICCPGASQPTCHNAIEAMAVGAIPIIEYADRFHPKLVDGDNAVCFQGEKGLAVAIRRIESMSPEKQSRMSANACAYYDEHLDGAKFLKRLRDELNTDFVDQLSMPFHDRNLFSTASPPSGHVPSRRSRAA